MLTLKKISGGTLNKFQMTPSKSLFRVQTKNAMFLNFQMGTCYTAEECEDNSGTASGSCADGYGVCCICK